jgi:hypothetical protein
MVVVLATGLAAVLSLLFIGDKSLWIDEGASLYFAHDAAGLWERLVHREANMWLYYLLLSLWLKLGDSEAFARGLSALFATAAVPLLYVLGRRLFGARAGAIAALLLASHAFVIRYAQEVRGYTLLIFLVVLSSYFFVKAVDEGSRGSWIGHGVAMGLAIHAHFFAALVYVAHLLSAALAGKKAACGRGFWLSTAIITAFLIPIALFQPLASGQTEWVPPLTFQRLYWFFIRIAGGGRSLLLLYLVFWVLALVFLTWRRAEHAASRERWHYLFVLAWIAVPVAVTAVFSLLVKPMFVERYLIVSLPPLVLLAGGGIARLRSRWLCVPILLVFLWGSARCLNRWYGETTKDDWRGATAYVLSEAHPGDGAVFYISAGRQCFDYYRGKQGGPAYPAGVELAIQTGTGRKLQVQQVDPQRLSSLPTTYERIWLLLSHDAAFPADRVRILGCLDEHYVLQSQRDFKSIAVRLYQKPSGEFEVGSGKDQARPRPPGPLRVRAARRGQKTSHFKLHTSDFQLKSEGAS